MYSILINQNCRSKEALKAASKISVDPSIANALKQNENTVTHLNDGVYHEEIVRFSQVSGMQFMNIFISIKNLGKVFKGNLFLNSNNQPLQEMYHVLEGEFDFSKLIGAEVWFTIKSNYSGDVTFSNIVELNFIEDNSQSTSNECVVKHVTPPEDKLPDLVDMLLPDN